MADLCHRSFSSCKEMHRLNLCVNQQQQPFKYHVVAFLLCNSIFIILLSCMMMYYIHYFCFVFDVRLVSLHSD